MHAKNVSFPFPVGIEQYLVNTEDYMCGREFEFCEIKLLLQHIFKKMLNEFFLPCHTT